MGPPGMAYQGEVADFGTTADPLVGKRIGGGNVLGGGLALDCADGVLFGALGDLSCADHIIAWKLHDRLGADFVPAGVNTRNEASRAETRAHGRWRRLGAPRPQSRSLGGLAARPAVGLRLA